VGSVVFAANKAQHSLPSVAGMPTAIRSSPMCAALAAFGVLWLYRFSVLALLAFRFLSGKAKTSSTPVRGLVVGGEGGSVVLLVHLLRLQQVLRCQLCRCIALGWLVF